MFIYVVCSSRHFHFNGMKKRETSKEVGYDTYSQEGMTILFTLSHDCLDNQMCYINLSYGGLIMLIIY